MRRTMTSNISVLGVPVWSGGSADVLRAVEGLALGISVEFAESLTEFRVLFAWASEPQASWRARMAFQLFTTCVAGSPRGLASLTAR
jgi:hypothetical protein